MRSTTRSLLPLLLLAGVLCAAGRAHAIDLTAGGDWSRSIDAADLQGGPGSDLGATYESSGLGTLAITGTAGNTDNWRVDVRRMDATWHADLSLSIRRTSDGAGGGLISGGEA